MARLLTGYGHEVKLISPQFVRPFVKSNRQGGPRAGWPQLFEDVRVMEGAALTLMRSKE
jgi:hypothetical protein